MSFLRTETDKKLYFRYTWTCNRDVTEVYCAKQRFTIASKGFYRGWKQSLQLLRYRGSVSGEKGRGEKRRWPTASRGPRRTKVYGCVRLRRRASNFTLSLHNPGCEYNTRRVFIFHGRIHRSYSNDRIESNFISVIPVNEKERENANKRGINVSYNIQVRNFFFLFTQFAWKLFKNGNEISEVTLHLRNASWRFATLLKLYVHVGVDTY